MARWKLTGGLRGEPVERPFESREIVLMVVNAAGTVAAMLNDMEAKAS